MSIKTKILGTVRKVGMKVSAKSPTIMVVAGTIGLIAAGVIAAKKSATELNAVLEEHKADKQKLKDIRDGVVVLDDISTEEYAEKKYKKHLTTLYIRTGKKIVKIFALPFTVAAVSAALVLGGHGINCGRLRKSIAETYAAYETLGEYRKRVAGQIGTEAEELLFLNGEKVIATDQITDPKTGETKTESEEMIHGPETKGVYRYICSRETMKPHAWYDFETREKQYLTLSVEQLANDWLDENDFILLRDIMQHNWKESYLKKHTEVFTDGWWRRNPFGEALPLIHPVVMKVKKISQPGEEAKYEVIFNAQGNIVQAMNMAERNNLEEKFRFKKKPKGRLKPA